MNKPNIIYITLLIICSIIGCKNNSKTEEEQSPPLQESTTKQIVDKYESGDTSRIYTLINGKKEGIMSDFSLSGEIISLRNFENDVQSGKSIIYYESGALKENQFYINGRKEGADTVWHESGNINFIYQFKDGKKHGDIYLYDDNKKQTFHILYRNDTIIEVNGKKVDVKKF